MKEIWKSIKGFEGLYEVSSLGHVHSLDRIISGKFYRGKDKKLFIDKNTGYLKVSLCKDMITYCVCVHRIVAEAFIPNPENLPEVDHINTIRSDARVTNLRWTTRKGNLNNPITKRRIYIEAHKKESITKAIATRIKNRRKTAPKTVYQYSLDGMFIRKYDCIRIAAKENNTRASDITRVCRNKRGGKSAGGYMWSYNKIEPKYEPYKSKCKRIGQYDKNGELIKIWDSLLEATKETGINNISRASKIGSKRPIAGGFMWKYL